MELNKDLFPISKFRDMEVIEILTGSRMGFIKDIKIDIENYKIKSIIIPSNEGGIFSKKEDTEIPWEKVVKIGRDIILVEWEGLNKSLE